VAHRAAGQDEQNVATAGGAHAGKQDMRVAGQVKQQAAATQLKRRLLAAAGCSAIAAREERVGAEAGCVCRREGEVHDETEGGTAEGGQEESGRTHGCAGRLQALESVAGFRGAVGVNNDAGRSGRVTVAVGRARLVDVGEAVAAYNGAAAAVAIEQRTARLRQH
jgi:hypothetical protein